MPLWPSLPALFADHLRNYRSIVRGFLSYLHQQQILKKDLAPLLIGAAQFAKAKPPKFLRPHEVQQLFDSLPSGWPKVFAPMPSFTWPTAWDCAR